MIKNLKILKILKLVKIIKNIKKGNTFKSLYIKGLNRKGNTISI